jgi:hypothetical protein
MNERDRNRGRRGAIGMRIGLAKTSRKPPSSERRSRQKQKSTKIFLLPKLSTQIQRGAVLACRDKVPVFTGVMARVCL